MSELTKCSTCGKEYSINADACVHCGEPNVQKAAASKRWYHNPVVVVILLVIFFPAGLGAMWGGKVFPSWVRWVITFIIVSIIIVSLGDTAGNDTSFDKTPTGKEITDAFSPYCYEKVLRNSETGLLIETFKQKAAEANVSEEEFNSKMEEVYTDVEKQCMCMAERMSSSLSSQSESAKNRMMRNAGKAFLSGDASKLSSPEQTALNAAGLCAIEAM